MANDQGLINAIQSLIQRLDAQFVAKGGKLIADPADAIFGPSGTKGGKNMADLLSEQIDAMRSLTETMSKSSKDTKETFVEHAQRLERFGLALNAMAPAVQMATKYGITRPYELLGGTPGQVGRGMLEAERDAGKVMTHIGSAIALLGNLVLPGAGTLGAIGVQAFGAMGGNQLIGRTFFHREAQESAALRSIAEMTQAGIPGFQEASMIQYGLGKVGVTMGGMGARGTAQGFARDLTLIGLSAKESENLMAVAIQRGGALGFRRLTEEGGAKAITEMVNKGIYGTDPVAIAASLSAGLRMGFTRESLEAASRRTGIQIPELTQAATIARMQTFLGAPGVTDRFFTAATSTAMARELGAPAAIQTMTQLAGGAAAAAEGNEAQEMLLFQQFQRANPGSSYMDFLEARRNKETDERWRRTVARTASFYGAQGQQGKVLGAALIGTRPMFVEGAGTFMGQTLPGAGVGEIMGEKGKPAALYGGAAALYAAQFDITLASAAKFNKAYGDQIEEVGKSIRGATLAGSEFKVFMDDLAKIMDRLSRTPFGLLLDRIMPRETSTEEGPGWTTLTPP